MRDDPDQTRLVAPRVRKHIVGRDAHNQISPAQSPRYMPRLDLMPVVAHELPVLFLGQELHRFLKLHAKGHQERAVWRDEAARAPHHQCALDQDRHGVRDVQYGESVL